MPGGTGNLFLLTPFMMKEWSRGVQVRKLWFQPGTALKRIAISSSVPGTRYSCDIMIFLQCHNCDLAKWHHDLCRCTNSQHPACIVIFAGAPTVSVLHASWSLQEHQRSTFWCIVILAGAPTVSTLHASWFLQEHQWPASCMHCDLCRSTNCQHPACIMIFAGAPTVSILHASRSLQEHQQSASWCIMIFAGAPTVSILHAL